MHLKLFIKLTLAGLIVCTTSQVNAQATPAATSGASTLSLGAGISAFNPDWGPPGRRIWGTTLWGDWIPNRVPPILHGIGLEVEVRDLNFDRTNTDPNLVLKAAGGGVIYSWRRYRNFHPYVKGLMEFGGLDWTRSNYYRYPENCGTKTIPCHYYDHDTRTVYVAGGGLEYRVYRKLWARADWEYQGWPDLFGHKRLDPEGFTIGAMYHFGDRPHNSAY
jgi:hypothetical protein